MDLTAFRLDPDLECTRICSMIKSTALGTFRRKGVVVGLSGGVDSATVLALAVLALGKNRVLAVMMPEKDSDPMSQVFARQVASKFGADSITEDLTAALTSLGCYNRRDSAVRDLFPDYDPTIHDFKIVLPRNLLDRGSLNTYSVVLVDKDGRERQELLPPHLYLKIIAASNMKQRIRMLTLYFHAEQRNFAVIGTANKNEHDQGFFVKYGDGGSDLQPIQHLFKSQVYQLARHLGVPASVIERTPTTDTYSASCSQEEFFFRLPFELMDLIWFGLEQEIPAKEVADQVGLSEEQVERVFHDLAQKQRSTDYLRAVPITLEAVP